MFPVLSSFPCVVPNCPAFSLSRKTDNQIPYFPCAVATLCVCLLQKLELTENSLRIVNYPSKCLTVFIAEKENGHIYVFYHYS